jgi:hypothetical protein
MIEMSTSLPRYTNESPPEFLRTLGNSYFTEQQLAESSDELKACLIERQAYREAHPAVAIYRWATEGSQTRNGGVIQQATTQLEITLESGQQVYVAQVGDCAVYADGSTAQIVTGAGEKNSHFALVGSILDNADEIINTPQGAGFFVLHKGERMAEDFLPTIEG